MGDLLTYKAHRLLLPGQSLAREYEHDDISAVMAVGTTNPADPEKSIYSPEYGPVYERLLADGFSGVASGRSRAAWSAREPSRSRT